MQATPTFGNTGSEETLLPAGTVVPNQLTGLFHECERSFTALGTTSFLLPQRASEHRRSAESKGQKRASAGKSHAATQEALWPCIGR